MTEALLFWTLSLWFAFYLVNHAELFDRLRGAVIPVLPRWLAYPLQCGACFTFWTLSALSLFIGFTPLCVLCPPCVLMFDLIYRRLKL